jgi:hypothetical protein
MRKALGFLRARLVEPSSWAGFAASLTAAYVLPHGWNYAVAACGCLAILFAERK